MLQASFSLCHFLAQNERLSTVTYCNLSKFFILLPQFLALCQIMIVLFLYLKYQYSCIEECLLLLEFNKISLIPAKQREKYHMLLEMLRQLMIKEDVHMLSYF